MSTGTVPARRSAQEQTRLEAALADLMERQINFNAVIGMKIRSQRRGDVRIGFAMKPELVGHSLYGRLHGGVIASVLDVVGALAVLVEIGERHPAESAKQVMHRFARFGTIDLRVDYLRQGIGQEFTANAEVTRLGGRVGCAQMRLVNEVGELISTGAAAYIVS
jgi:uncharacterized protein (TIGR00369 family)